MARMETHDCFHCEGEGQTGEGAPCCECDGSGRKDYVAFDTTAELLEWLGTDVED